MGSPDSPEAIKVKYESNLNTNAFTDDEKTKLSALEDSHFKGVYVSEESLNIAYPTAELGDYAYVEDGEIPLGLDYFAWDGTVWILTGDPASINASEVKILYESNADTNAFTDAEKALVASNAVEVAKIDPLDVRVTANEVAIVHLNDTGMTVRTGSNIAPQTIAITATRVISFDTTTVEAGTGTLWDIANGRMKATSDGIFKLRYESFVSYASNVNITWQIYKNGAPFGNSITLSGQGATVFPLVLLSSTPLLADDYLELHGTASASTPLTVVQANGTLEKTHFAN